MILYLHGFRSSPQSSKAQLIGQRLQALGREAEYRSPQLPASPQQAIRLALDMVRDCTPAELTLIGSSLGGYYATWLAEQLGCRAVLLNPAVAPLPEMEKHIGVTTAYHSAQRFEFKAEYLEQIKTLAVSRITRPQRYFLIAATGDEVLDWRRMVMHYAGARQCIIDGSNHGLSDFSQYLDQVLAFCAPGAGV